MIRQLLIITFLLYYSRYSITYYFNFQINNFKQISISFIYHSIFKVSKGLIINMHYCNPGCRMIANVFKIACTRNFFLFFLFFLFNGKIFYSE